MVQLPQIARPCVRLEERHHIRRDARHRAGCGQPVVCHLRAQQAGHHHGEVRALPQRRQPHHQAIQAVVQIGTEAALGHHVAQVAVGGADDVHVHVHLPRGPQRRHAALLQHAQQPRLQGQRHVSDFIQEQRSAVRLHDLAHTALAACAREGALLVAEQFRLDQRLGNRRAIDGHERLPGARPVVVDGAGQQFFARARLTQDQRGHVPPQQPRHPLDHDGKLRISRIQIAQAGQPLRCGTRACRPARRTRRRGGLLGGALAVLKCWRVRRCIGWLPQQRCRLPRILGQRPDRHAARQLQRQQACRRAVACMGQHGAHGQAEQRREGVGRQRLGREPQLKLSASVGGQKAAVGREGGQALHQRADEFRPGVKTQPHRVLEHFGKEVVLHHLGRHPHQRHRVRALAAVVAAHIQRTDDPALRVQDGRA